ncbi:MAG: PD-(D/E)XK nuclease family protein [Chloroflexota bacterium]
MPLPNPFAFSQSSLQDYADCPRRFQLRYIEQLQYPAAESEPALENEKHQQEGQIFHRLVQQSLLGLPDERLARLANTPNLARWWENFRAHRPSLNGYTIYPELALSAPLGTTRLVAKYDLTAVREGEALVYDWKTYLKRPRNEWLAARWQTRVYRYLLAAAGSSLNGGQAFVPERIEMVYWFADFPTDPAVFRYDAVQFKRDRSVLETIVQEIGTRQEFELTEDVKKCQYCTFRSYCNRGDMAGDWKDAEAEAEAQTETFDLDFEQIGEIAF